MSRRNTPIKCPTVNQGLAFALLNFLYISRTCRTVKSDKSGDNGLKLLCSAWAFQRHAPFFFLMQGRRKARIWIFRAHLTQSSVMTIGFGASVGALRRRISIRVLITVSKLRASPLQYSTPFPPAYGILSGHLGCVTTLGRDKDQVSQAEQGTDALMVPSPTRNGRRTDLLLVYLEYPPVCYAAFA